MSTLTVSVQQDHLEKLVRTPLVGLAELVWNGLDADATEILVRSLKNDAGGLDGLEVADNGSGMNRERAAMDFERLGGSWKKTGTATDGGRSLHGKNGQGRWSAYGIGEQVTWETVATATATTTGQKQRLRIAGRRTSLREFQLSEAVDVDDEAQTGTTVTISELNERAVKDLEKPGSRVELTAVLALYLEQYPVTVTWDGVHLDPGLLQDRRTEVQLEVDGIDDTVNLVIIEWNTSVPRSMHLCDASGLAYTHVQPGIQAPGFDFTAYLKWDGFRERHSEVMLGEMAGDPIPAVLDAAKDALREHFKERQSERGTELIAAWKADDTYPYSDEPAGSIAKVERELFEIVAVTAASAFENAEPKSRALGLRLLREALETSPSTLPKAIEHILDLPEDRQNELAELLERTTVSNLISAARSITDRLDFVAGLEEIVFDTELRKHVLERRQLHRILAGETWVFREEYALTADDHSLSTALRNHVSLLGRDDLAAEDLDDEVTDSDGKRMVVDLMLSRVVEQPHNKREHIVIELKRPTVHVGMEEFSQIQRYASAVANDSRFEQTNTTWEFWIVGDAIEQPVMDMEILGKPPGTVVASKSYTVRAVTWGTVIQDARHRLKFVRDLLDIRADAGTGLEFLQRTHDKYLPEPAATATAEADA